MRAHVVVALALALTGLSVAGAAELDRGAIPRHIQALRDENQTGRLHAARDLGVFGTAAKDAVGPLSAALLKEQSPQVRGEMVRSLGRIGPAGVPTLEKLAEAADATLRLQAIRALSNIGPEAKDALPTVTKALRDRDARVRARAAFALGEIAVDPQVAPPLIAALRDSDRSVCVQAANSLIRIGPAAVPFLAEGLSDQHSRARYWSAYALGMIGPEAKEAVPALTRALKDQERSVHMMAAATLGEIGCEAGPAVAGLMADLKDTQQEVRTQAALSLAAIGQPAVPHLVEAAVRGDSTLQTKALFVLGMIGADAKEAVPALMEIAKGKDSTRRALACVALGQIGPEAQKSVPTLTSLLNDKEVKVRVAAALALARIEPDNPKAQNRLEEDIARISNSKNSPGWLAQQDRQRVASIERFIDFFIYITSFEFGVALSQRAKLEASRLGPDAIPALVRALNTLNVNKEGKVAALEADRERTFWFV